MAIPSVAVLGINDLPDETLVALFQSLSAQELLVAELVCQRWRDVAQVLWKPIFDASPYSRWWMPYQPSTDLTALKERREGQQLRRGINYKWGYLIKNKSTERWLKFASFRRVGRGLSDHSEDYGGVVKWFRNESANGRLGPNRIALRALLVGEDGAGCHTLSSTLEQLFPGVCIALDRHRLDPFGQVQVNISWEEEQEAQMLLQYKREVEGTPFMFGPLPLEVEYEVASVVSVDSRSELVRTELHENVRPTVVLAAFSLEHSSSFKRLREEVMPSIRTRFNDVPILLVGTKCDTRVGENVFVDGSEMRVHVSSASPTYEQGLELCYEVGAKNYLECSSLTRDGLPRLVSETAELGVRHMLHFFSRADLETRPKGLEWEGDETDRAEVHEKIRCNGCEVGPVVGNCYKCVTCPDYHLCQSCFERRDEVHAPGHSYKLFHAKKSGHKRHTHTSTSFRAGFRHRSSLPEYAAAAETLESNTEDREAAETLQREQEVIRRKGCETFQRTGLDESWKASVEDVFRMFSKSPDTSVKRKRAVDEADEVKTAAAKRTKRDG